MTTNRRLSDNDVRAIFESIHNDTPPPPHLPFKVVPVGSDGKKLSPPPYLFDDGLFVLLQPSKKSQRKSTAIQRVPSSLRHLVFRDISKSESLTWSLSGPQFPKPTAIQQRYCYPRGDDEYCGRKGGALWTICMDDGKENTEYRLLHVYYSAKRAGNKGLKVDPSQVHASKRPKLTPSRETPLAIQKRPDPLVARSSSASSFGSLRQSTASVLNAALYDSPLNLLDDRFRDAEDDADQCGASFVTPDIFSEKAQSNFPYASLGLQPQTLPWEASLPPLDMTSGDDASLEMPNAGLDNRLPTFSASAVSNKEERVQRFAQKLETVRNGLRDEIVKTPQRDERTEYAGMVTDWAKKLVASPFGKDDTADKDEDASRNDEETKEFILDSPLEDIETTAPFTPTTVRSTIVLDTNFHAPLDDTNSGEEGETNEGGGIVEMTTKMSDSEETETVTTTTTATTTTATTKEGEPTIAIKSEQEGTDVPIEISTETTMNILAV